MDHLIVISPNPFKTAFTATCGCGWAFVSTSHSYACNLAMAHSATVSA